MTEVLANELEEKAMSLAKCDLQSLHELIADPPWRHSGYVQNWTYHVVDEVADGWDNLGQQARLVAFIQAYTSALRISR